MLLAVPDLRQAIHLHLGLLRCTVPGWGPQTQGVVVMAISVVLGMPIWAILACVAVVTHAMVVTGMAISFFLAGMTLAIVVVMWISVWMILHRYDVLTCLLAHLARFIRCTLHIFHKGFFTVNNASLGCVGSGIQHESTLESFGVALVVAMLVLEVVPALKFVNSVEGLL